MMLDASEVDRTLSAASDLARDGRGLEAIERLSNSYAVQADPRIARRLVEVRHEAFAEVSKLPGRDAWPPVFADPFPGQDGLIDIAPDELSGDVLGGAITHHGCLRVNGLIDLDTAEGFRDRIESAFAARDRFVAGAALEVDAPFVPFGPGRFKAEVFGRNLFVRAVDTPDALCDLVDIFTATGIKAAVAEYLGERPAMIANKWVLRRSDGGMALTDFHQDGAFLGDGIRTVDCWIALSDCGPGTGRPAVDLLAGRVDDILPTGESGAAFTWSLAEQTVLDAVPDLRIESPVFTAGDALFFDERLPHRTSVGVDLGTRYAIESWFVAPSSYPEKHVPIVL